MDEQLSQGIGLFNDGEFFRCHEVLEEAWRLERRPRRLFLQALIHLAVGSITPNAAIQLVLSVSYERGLKSLRRIRLRARAWIRRDYIGRHSRPPSLSKRRCPYPRIRRFVRTPVHIRAATHHLGE
jgi:hypothetical protein